MDHLNAHHTTPVSPESSPVSDRSEIANSSGSARSRKRKAETTQRQSPSSLPILTPPYERHERPVISKLNKNGTESKRKYAEISAFPWHRTDIDFSRERDAADWDDSIYSADSTRRMDDTRARNHPVVERLDQEHAAQQSKRLAARKQKVSANSSKSCASEARQGQTDSAPDGPAKIERGGRKKSKGGATPSSDPYHSGTFQFASLTDQAKAESLGDYSTPEDLLLAGERGDVDLETLKGILICWSPGKKGMTHDLEQVEFSVHDTLVTREALAKKPVFTWAAAERLIDFCPDQLWRGTLLRVVSESGMGNKDIRARFCRNGSWCDNATITKRISAALGQKQKQQDQKGLHDRYNEWYHANVRDHEHYTCFFSKRQPRGNLLRSCVKRLKLALEAADSGEPGALQKPEHSGSGRMPASDEVQASGEVGGDDEEDAAGASNESDDDDDVVTLTEDSDADSI
ncbi:hypothetical protein K431DRAFT_285282 [Polychaeton citri CBS 116435]|uniref:Uncharacterized protein n=1 Tax=Polychaeton citri CBS 116435 TaxID=1314669 RepID=A0A9P4QA56_9PEZI|nr:hypothetical protein K431DRAFT_285282 [Polychaeton citri CBS 116435]